MVEGAPFRNPAASSDGSSYPFIDVVLPDGDALWPRPSTARRDILPQSHPFSSRPLFEGSLGIADAYQKCWQQHTILCDPCSIDALIHIYHTPSRNIFNPDNYDIRFVLCTCISRQAIPYRTFKARSLRLVQAQATTSLRPPSAREQQFRSD